MPEHIEGLLKRCFTPDEWKFLDKADFWKHQAPMDNDEAVFQIGEALDFLWRSDYQKKERSEVLTRLYSYSANADEQPQ